MILKNIDIYLNVVCADVQHNVEYRYGLEVHEEKNLVQIIIEEQLVVLDIFEEFSLLGNYGDIIHK